MPTGYHVCLKLFFYLWPIKPPLTAVNWNIWPRKFAVTPKDISSHFLHNLMTFLSGSQNPSSPPPILQVFLPFLILCLYDHPDLAPSCYGSFRLLTVQIPPILSIDSSLCMCSPFSWQCSCTSAPPPQPRPFLPLPLKNTPPQHLVLDLLPYRDLFRPPVHPTSKILHVFRLISCYKILKSPVRAGSIFFENSRRYSQLKVHHGVANGKNLQSEEFKTFYDRHCALHRKHVHLTHNESCSINNRISNAQRSKEIW
jgi:hypothetical protein